MSELYNLVVDLDEEFALAPEAAAALETAIPGVRIEAGVPADGTTLAWIDERFGGWWSSEAGAGSNAIATRGGLPVGFATFDPQGLRFRWLRGLGAERSVGIFGPFGVEPDQRGAGVGRVLLRFALAGLRAKGYSRALIAAVGERLVPFYSAAVGARVTEPIDRSALLAPRPRALVLASGSGSNFQAVAERVAAGTLPIDLIGVVTNDSNAGVVARASELGIDVTLLPWQRRDEPRATYDVRLLESAVSLDPDVVLLLGWMHLLDERFVRMFPNLINLHPAFLPLDPGRDLVDLPDGSRMPAFRGVHAVRDALAHGAHWIGATVHAVTNQTDRGPVLTRKPMRIRADEDEAHVMRRLHPMEHELVAAAIMRWLYERP